MVCPGVCQFSCNVEVCSNAITVAPIYRDMGLSDTVTLDVGSGDDDADTDGNSFHENETDEGIESLYNLENYDDDKGKNYPRAIRYVFTPLHSTVQVSPCLGLAWVTVSLVWPTLLPMKTTLT